MIHLYKYIILNLFLSFWVHTSNFKFFWWYCITPLGCKTGPQRGCKGNYLPKIQSHSQTQPKERTNNMIVPVRQKAKPFYAKQDKLEGKKYPWEIKDQQTMVLDLERKAQRDILCSSLYWVLQTEIPKNCFWQEFSPLTGFGQCSSDPLCRLWYLPQSPLGCLKE